MSYNITALPAYTSEQSRKFMLKSILGGQTVDFLVQNGSFDPEAMGNVAIQLIDTDIVWQDGAICKLSELGATNLSQNILSVQPIGLRMALCVRTLTKTFLKEELKTGEKMTDEVLVNVIGEDVANKNKSEIEKLIWQGDKTLTGTDNRKWIDGYLKQLATGTFALGTLTGTTFEKIRKAYLAMPIAVTEQEDFRIFMGLDTYNAYLAEISDKNVFHQTGEKLLHGTAVKIEVVNGLNGTEKVVFARARNLQSGGDLKNVELDQWYSKDDGDIKLEARFSLGATVIYKQEIGVLNLGA